MQYTNLIQAFTQQHCNQPTVIFGLGREGWSTYHFLHTHLPDLQILLLDDQPLEKLPDNWQDAVKQPSVKFWQSNTVPSEDLLPNAAVVYKTPGVPPDHQVLIQLTSSAFKHSSNTQLFLECIQFCNQKQPTQKQIQTIGITGTKGKSTTASLIAAALSRSPYTPILGGNIGRPPLDLTTDLQSVPDTTQPAVILELSCHQLADLSISPHIAVIQEITPEHLDYYQSVWHYVAAKSGIVRSQLASDTVVTCTEHKLPLLLASLTTGTHITYQVSSITPTLESATPAELQALVPKLPAILPPTPTPRVHCNADSLLIDAQAVGSIETLQTELKLAGMHNRYNLLAAITACIVLGVPYEQILTGLHTFEPLLHRLQLVAEKNGVRYINDSLATTPEAAAAAIASFADSPVVLIAGGHDRHLDFTPLVDTLLTHTVKGLVLFPPTGELISETLHKRHPGTLLGETQFKVQTMPEAVQVASKLAKSGDVVLLSPASASFGTFRDYQDRGEQFAAAVAEL